MKSIIFSLAFCSFLTPAIAQLSFEHTYNRAFVILPCNLDEDGYKYAFYDSLSKSVAIYNLDHTIWKNINVNVPSSTMGTTQIQWVSKKLFHLDNKIEFVLSYAQFIDQKLIYTTRVYNEDGAILHTLDDVFMTGVFDVGGQYKLLAYKTDNYTKDVYGLPGRYNDQLGIGDKERTESQLYPNPVQGVAKLSYSLPDNVSSGQINIYTATGSLIRQLPIGRGFDHVIIHRDNLPAGNYTYEIVAPNYRSATNKFTIL